MEAIASKVIEIITKQFYRIVNNLAINRKVEVYEERTFELLNANNKLNSNIIYIVIHFDNSTLMMGGLILPLVIEVMSSSDVLEQDLNILFTYATTYNFNPPDIGNIFMQQSYSGPNIESAFEKVGGEFRALISMNGTISVGNEVLGIKEIYIDNEKMLYTALSFGCSMEPNSVNIGDNNGFVHNINRIGASSISISLVALNKNYGKFFYDLMLEKVKINTKRTLKFILNDNTIYEQEYIINDIELKQSIGGIPNFSVSFVRA